MQVTSIIALDVGERRIGVALANTIAQLPQPLTTLEYDDRIWDSIQDLIRQESVTELVVGLPRNMNGDETAQTEFTRAFVDELEKHIELPVHFQDESLTSKKAEQELDRRRKPYKKGDIDALAATYILEDYLQYQRTKS